jgi:hypothetical protein
MNGRRNASFFAWLASPIRPLVGVAPIALKRSIGPFLMTRLMILILLALTPAIMSRPVDNWNRDDGTALRISRQAVAEAVERVAIVNDAAWYFSIATHGYDERRFDTSRQANWAFFPLHPLLWRASAAVTGEWVWSGVMLSNILFLSALCLLWQLVRELTRKDSVADSAVWFACLWPSSYFMSLPHTEALFLLLGTASLLAMERRALAAAGVVAALASAARFNGLFLVAAMTVAWWRGERRPTHLSWLAVGAAGAIAFGCFLWWVTGNALAFKDIQAAWGRQFAPPWAAIQDYLGHPAKLAVAWNPRLLHFFACLVGLFSIVACWRRGWHEIAVFTGLTVAAPLCTGTLTSMTRYLGVAPGLFLALAAWSYENPRLGRHFFAASTLCLTVMTVLFAAGFNMAGA